MGSASAKPDLRAMIKVPKPKSKALKQEYLPSRSALTQLTKGTPTQRSLGNYAKKTPSGAGALR